MVSIISVNSSTYNTSSPFPFPFFTPVFIWCRGKKMSMYAVNFTSIYRWWTITSQSIFSLRTKCKMCWVTTFSVIAYYMVKNRNTISYTFRNRFNKISIHKSMNHLCIPSKIKYTISSIFNFCTIPIPTLSRRVKRYFREHTFEFILCKINFKVFNHV